MIVEQKLELESAPATVFDFLADQQNWMAMDPETKEIAPRGAVVEGMTGTMKRRVGGLPVTNGFTVTEIVSPTRMSMRLTGVGYVMTETISLDDTAHGTRATIVDTLEPTSLVGRLFVAASGRFVRRDLIKRAARLKALLEAMPPK